MNAVDRSDQMLACRNVSRKCYRWWKTLFYHLVDMAVVNGFLLFQQHCASDPDNPALHRRSTYNIVDFREELVRQICGLAEYDRPPANETVQTVPRHDQFCVVHMPKTAEKRKHCVVCYQKGLGQRFVYTYCSAPQCNNKHMHVGAKFDCFEVWHSSNYTGNRT
jgi:hypothetical protein